MLILSRRPGDAILIDGGIRIVVLAADQRTVRIGIEAPSKIGILREEIALPLEGEGKLTRIPQKDRSARRNGQRVAATLNPATA
ncbi:MAG: carbon storage regulator [Longimicrobiales bacterium]